MIIQTDKGSWVLFIGNYAFVYERWIYAHDDLTLFQGAL